MMLRVCAPSSSYAGMQNCEQSPGDSMDGLVYCPKYHEPPSDQRRGEVVGMKRKESEKTKRVQHSQKLREFWHPTPVPIADGSQRRKLSYFSSFFFFYSSHFFGVLPLTLLPLPLLHISPRYERKELQRAALAWSDSPRCRQAAKKCTTSLNLHT